MFDDLSLAIGTFPHANTVPVVLPEPVQSLHKGGLDSSRCALIDITTTLHYNLTLARSLISDVQSAPDPEILMQMHFHPDSPDGWNQSSPHACPPSPHD